MNRSNLSTLAHKSYFTILPLAFLFVNNLTKHLKINNMILVRLTWFSDFIQVLNCIRKHTTMSERLSKHILFTTIYLLQKQKLNHRNYSKQEIFVSNFIQAT
jgi:hypothetical protein